MSAAMPPCCLRLSRAEFSEPFMYHMTLLAGCQATSDHMIGCRYWCSPPPLANVRFREPRQLGLNIVRRLKRDPCNCRTIVAVAPYESRCSVMVAILRFESRTAYACAASRDQQRLTGIVPSGLPGRRRSATETTDTAHPHTDRRMTRDFLEIWKPLRLSRFSGNSSNRR